MNDVLHSCMKKTWHEMFVVRHLIEELEKIILFWKPKLGIFLAVDGIGPLAKCSTQIRRRRKNVKEDKFDPIQATPGTSTIPFNYFEKL